MESFLTGVGLLLATVANEPTTDQTFKTVWSSAIIYRNYQAMDCVECSLHEEVHSIIKSAIRNSTNVSQRQGLAEWQN